MAAFRVSNAAKQDIRNIGRYTQAEWGAAQRRQYLDGLNDKFNALADMPEMAAERRDFEPPVRLHPYERHLIVYIIDDEGILIVRVLHQSMDVPTQLKEK